MAASPTVPHDSGCYCPGSGKVRRYRPDGSRYLACDKCGADVTDPDDRFADRCGGIPALHRPDGHTEVVL